MIGLLFDKTDRDGQPLTASSLKNDYWSIKQHLHVEYYHKTLRLFWLLIARVSFHCSTLIFLIARLLAILVLPGLEKITKKRERERLDCVVSLYCFFFLFFYLVLLDLFIVRSYNHYFRVY
jgi:predicted PurR-regulated permease PerM